MCVKCGDYYNLNEGDNQCYKIDDILCKEYDNKFNRCRTCDEGYIENNGVCSKP